jgi:hydrogenase nickel incorporation protein HypA/HybF
MHELAVCQALLVEVERVAREAGAAGVRRVVLRVGPLSGVEPALLHRAFDVARAGGIAAAAELSFEAAAVRVRCRECSAEGEVPANRLLCPHCGSWRTELRAGDEMVLQRVEFGGLPCATPAAAT